MLYESLPIWGQNLACTWAGYVRSRQRYTEHFHRMLAEWERSIDWPLDALHEIQRRRLDELVRHARLHVPHYKGLPEPSRTSEPLRAIVETLAEIPVLEKRTYRDAPDQFLATNMDQRRLIPGKTSGTTGTALKLWWTPEALAEEFATFWRGRRRAGARLDDANLTFNGQVIVPFEQKQPPFWRTNYWNRQTLFSIYHMTPEALASYVDGVHAAPGRFVQGYPSSLYLVARALIDAGHPLPSGRLVAVFTSSESLLAFQRETIEEGFGAPVSDRYGVGEFCVSMTQCSERRLHVDMEFGIVEVEPEEETEEFVRGPLLVTGFANRATPLIRYRVGDLGTKAKTPCPCGRAGDVFLDVDGRTEDYVATPDGRLVGRIDHIFKDQVDVAEAQVLQEVPNALHVRVVRRPTFDEASEHELLRQFRSRLGSEIAIELHYVDAIPREPNGKFRAVKSQVGALQR